MLRRHMVRERLGISVLVGSAMVMCQILAIKLFNKSRSRKYNQEFFNAHC